MIDTPNTPAKTTFFYYPVEWVPPSHHSTSNKIAENGCKVQVS